MNLLFIPHCANMNTSHSTSRAAQTVAVSAETQQAVRLMDLLVDCERDTLFAPQLPLFAADTRRFVQESLRAAAASSGDDALAASRRSSTLAPAAASDAPCYQADVLALDASLESLCARMAHIQTELDQTLAALEGLATGRSASDMPHATDQSSDEALARMAQAADALECAANTFSAEAGRFEEIWPTELQHWVEAALARPTQPTAIREARMQLDAFEEHHAVRRAMRQAHRRMAEALGTSTTTATTNDSNNDPSRRARWEDAWQRLGDTQEQIGAALARLERWQATLHVASAPHATNA
ncbi:hypothetical protein THASP1DRAFT_31108 [Thamnocephalis sphaerospora]|uniref:Uncharacterized protein n=1 Tax=Thamnocephalis sphaerospora TaxID=78915 RepID=A0A4P9XNU0_9FUNG|nr:hypothetical protein THASP1DRAFT_31108 [Thamnocephalis sphaerospora]|eukprot:RKP07081.1 hypothetical protein THASP1DRAFT_31108 [Thamnocephalis sphaerospora]